MLCILEGKQAEILAPVLFNSAQRTLWLIYLLSAVFFFTWGVLPAGICDTAQRRRVPWVSFLPSHIMEALGWLGTWCPTWGIHRVRTLGSGPLAQGQHKLGWKRGTASKKQFAWPHSRLPEQPAPLSWGNHTDYNVLSSFRLYNVLFQGSAGREWPEPDAGEAQCIGQDGCFYCGESKILQDTF